ncbi:ATP synthase [Planococcus glaciei]|uniref:TrkH family potassium uptake protein n=1 Tax=Planococcus glaciei TaxID=459472 RepID=A0A7H8Q5Q6_9BACL|nr:TrkH family potassium uptake protein [Planococcus glaciei]ETP68567.1 ATP synthase [Planococcus glaciei CHR43]KOF11429.1 ATP synthase [Planococcus glaciei]MBX0313585.1 TrkH family potassium uptake protein [Planococcus glaciei]QDY44620.1 TrkH family potassium uptake protein [Planococcus glaciei]QKX49266.1 TrkH family potassium uptake protein [Planococcus glaciei]
MNSSFQKLRNLTPAQAIVSYYFVAIASSFLLLRLPGVHNPGIDMPWLDSLFTAVSAVSVTGLTVVNISETYSVFGITMIMFILQLGGIGIMSLGTFFWLLIGKRIGLRERQLIMVDHNQFNMSGVVKLIREIIKILLLIELVGAVIFTLYFTQYFDTFNEALLQGIFASVSATTNGGFDITGQSLSPFFNDYFVQIINMILIILGAIGFPVLIEIKEFLSNKNKNFRFSLFTKITTSTFGILLVVGTLVLLAFESLNAFKGYNWHETLFAAMFHSVSSRSGGLTTMDITQFSEATNVFMSALMFIGASPSSVGGGIRTTTFAIALLFLINFARGKNTIQIFKREIELIDVFRSYAVIILACFMVLFATMALIISEPHATPVQIVFEITSAFGTCGMSLGITDDLSAFGKVVIMALMFIGRVGLISFLFTIGGKSDKTKFHYPKERVIIG